MSRRHNQNLVDAIVKTVYRYVPQKERRELIDNLGEVIRSSFDDGFASAIKKLTDKKSQSYYSKRSIHD